MNWQKICTMIKKLINHGNILSRKAILGTAETVQQVNYLTWMQPTWLQSQVPHIIPDIWALDLTCSECLSSWFYEYLSSHLVSAPPFQGSVSALATLCQWTRAPGRKSNAHPSQLWRSQKKKNDHCLFWVLILCIIFLDPWASKVSKWKQRYETFLFPLRHHVCPEHYLT